MQGSSAPSLRNPSGLADQSSEESSPRQPGSSSFWSALKSRLTSFSWFIQSPPRSQSPPSGASESETYEMSMDPSSQLSEYRNMQRERYARERGLHQGIALMNPSPASTAQQREPSVQVAPHFPLHTSTISASSLPARSPANAGSSRCAAAATERNNSVEQQRRLLQEEEDAAIARALQEEEDTAAAAAAASSARRVPSSSGRMQGHDAGPPVSNGRSSLSEDEALARRLQAEEEARARSRARPPQRRLRPPPAHLLPPPAGVVQQRANAAELLERVLLSGAADADPLEEQPDVPPFLTLQLDRPRGMLFPEFPRLDSARAASAADSVELRRLLARLQRGDSLGYEELQRLEELLGGAIPRGASRETIASLPTFRFTAPAPQDGGGGGGEKDGAQQTCAICLNAFAPGDEVKPLPRCLHRFHADCIDRWLELNKICPICREEL